MKLLLDNSTTYANEEIFKSAAHAASYVRQLATVAERNNYEADEASINLAFDTKLVEEVTALVTRKTSSALRYIFVVGIGGSNLGTKAVYDALYGYRDLGEEAHPRMIFVDTTNSALLRFYTEELVPTLKSSEEYLVVTISKSGGTTETLSNTEILLAALNQQTGDVTERTIVITDKDSAFWHAAEAASADHLAIPHKVGGRYSVLSAVGLFPLSVLGVDTKALLQGARDIRAYCLQTDIEHNPAWQSAALMAFSYRHGQSINNTFVFNSELESLGKWYRQLLGESIGKEHDQAGNQVHTGITPTVSVGSTDLHSVGQLYLGGPKDKLTTFVYSADQVGAVPVPRNRIFKDTVSMIDGKTTGDIMDAILGGVKIAYNKAQLPFMEVQLESITPYEIGAFMQFKMIEMMILGNLLDVNPFNQPNVESYKIETKDLLES